MLRSKLGSFELAEGETLIGRSRNCQVVVKDPSVSRSHAKLSRRGDRLTVRDLTSSNGTFVNGRRVEGEVSVSVGDTLIFGETRMELIELSGDGAELDYSFAGLIDEVEAESASIGAEILDPIRETLQSPEAGSEAAKLLVAQSSSLAALVEDGSDHGDSTGPGLPVVEPEIEFEPDEEVLPPLPEELSLPARPPAAPPPAPPRRAPPEPEPAEEEPAPGPPLLESDVVQEALRRLAPEDPVEEAVPAAVAVPPRGSAPPAPVHPSKPDSGEVLPSLDDLDDLDDFVAPPPLPRPATRPRPGPRTGELAPAPSLAHLDRMPRPRPAAEGPPAGIGSRLAAGLLDGLLVTVLAFLGSLAGGGPWRPEGAAIFYTALFGLALLIQVFGLNLWSTTPGKRLLGLKVYDRDGASTLPVGKALLRFGGYFVGAAALGTGFLMIFFTKNHRGLHDVLAGTYVGRVE